MLAMIAPPSLLAGVIGGGVLGALHHKGLGLKAEDRDRIAAELIDGKPPSVFWPPTSRRQRSPRSWPSSARPRRSLT